MSLSELSVADVRKALLLLRTACEGSSPQAPMDPSQLLIASFSMSEFAFLFVSSHHSRRKSAGKV